MKRLDEYIIPLKGLEGGTQELKFCVDRAFIECFNDDEISDSDVDVILLITKTTHTFELHFKIKGNIHVPCDRCLDEMNLKIKGDFNLFLKYGEEFSEIDDEVIIIPREEGFFDLSSYVYEFVKLIIPISKFHKKGECNPEMLSRIIKTKADKKQDIDPRWEVLKKLGNNN